MKLYIDDIRNPKGEFDKVVRNSDEAIEWLVRFGCPEYISWDFDLGGDDNSMVIAKWLVEMDMSMDGDFIPEGFCWNIHSANPVGGAAVNSYLKSYLRIKESSE